MNINTQMEFCIIPSPYSNGLKNLVFIAYEGTGKVDSKLIYEKEYSTVKIILNKYGFVEIDSCVFETEEDSIVEVVDLKDELLSAGLIYSKILENNVIAEMIEFHKEIFSKKENLLPESQHITFSTTTPVVINKSKSKLPAVGEKLSLHFYLFLQCHFINENDCILELIGDLSTRDNNNNRNFIQIVKSDFIRLESSSPNVILLQSVKTYGDFINEINILHKGNFKFVKQDMNYDGDMILKTKEFIYNFLEIKKNINPLHKIVVEANINQYFDNMIIMSKKIKKEYNTEQKKIISLESIKPEMVQLKNKLSNKMLDLASFDEFEKANLLKKDILVIDNKISIIDSLEEKNITFKEYFKTFCLNR